MLNLPQHISDAISSFQTSLGDSPCFPENPTTSSFVMKMVSDEFTKLKEKLGNPSVSEAAKTLNDAILECQKEEGKCRAALEELCGNLLKEKFQIPEDTIKITLTLVDSIDKSNARLMPDDNEDYSFDDIADMKHLGEEIHKRRFLNSLLEGASEKMAYNVNDYVSQIFEINPALPSLYSKITTYSTYLIFALDETEIGKSNGTGGDVEVNLRPAPEVLQMTARGTLFPILYQNAIKGLLEIAILQGLPDNKEKAYFVMGKADYKMAEVWDSRLGYCLWEKILRNIDKEELDEVGLNFFFMEISQWDTENFFQNIQEMLLGTHMGKEIISAVMKQILMNKEDDDFNNHIESQNALYPIEDGYFSEDAFSSVMPESY